MATTQKQDDPTVEGVLDGAIETLHLGLTALRDEILKIKSGKSKSNKHDKGSRIAFLTSKVGSIADSVRKVEAARLKRITSLTPALVLAWFRELDATEQARFLRELQTAGTKRSALA